MASPFTLKKQERLKSRKLIAQLFKQGKAFSFFPFRVICLWNQPDHQLQAGFSVSSRNFKRAVDRNRIKRLMREAYRVQKNELQLALEAHNKQLAIFLIYTGKELPQHHLVVEKMGSIIQQLIKRTIETPV